LKELQTSGGKSGTAGEFSSLNEASARTAHYYEFLHLENYYNACYHSKLPHLQKRVSGRSLLKHECKRGFGGVDEEVLGE
jgi:hypothetical protein